MSEKRERLVTSFGSPEEQITTTGCVYPTEPTIRGNWEKQGPG